MAKKNSKRKNRKNKRNRKPVAERNVLAYAVSLRGGAGAHTDKRKRRNQKGRKFDAMDGWE